MNKIQSNEKDDSSVSNQYDKRHRRVQAVRTKPISPDLSLKKAASNSMLSRVYNNSIAMKADIDTSMNRHDIQTDPGGKTHEPHQKKRRRSRDHGRSSSDTRRKLNIEITKRMIEYLQNECEAQDMNQDSETILRKYILSISLTDKKGNGSSYSQWSNDDVTNPRKRRNAGLGNMFDGIFFWPNNKAISPPINPSYLLPEPTNGISNNIADSTQEIVSILDPSTSGLNVILPKLNSLKDIPRDVTHESNDKTDLNQDEMLEILLPDTNMAIEAIESIEDKAIISNDSYGVSNPVQLAASNQLHAITSPSVDLVNLYDLNEYRSLLSVDYYKKYRETLSVICHDDTFKSTMDRSNIYAMNFKYNRGKSSRTAKHTNQIYRRKNHRVQRLKRNELRTTTKSVLAPTPQVKPSSLKFLGLDVMANKSFWLFTLGMKGKLIDNQKFDNINDHLESESEKDNTSEFGYHTEDELSYRYLTTDDEDKYQRSRGRPYPSSPFHQYHRKISSTYSAALESIATNWFGMNDLSNSLTNVLDIRLPSPLISPAQDSRNNTTGSFPSESSPIGQRRENTEDSQQTNSLAMDPSSSALPIINSNHMESKGFEDRLLSNRIIDQPTASDPMIRPIAIDKSNINHPKLITNSKKRSENMGLITETPTIKNHDGKNDSIMQLTSHDDIKIYNDITSGLNVDLSPMNAVMKRNLRNKPNQIKTDFKNVLTGFYDGTISSSMQDPNHSQSVALDDAPSIDVDAAASSTLREIALNWVSIGDQDSINSDVIDSLSDGLDVEYSAVSDIGVQTKEVNCKLATSKSGNKSAPKVMLRKVTRKTNQRLSVGDHKL